MSKHNKDGKPSSSRVYMSPKINSKDMETIYYTVHNSNLLCKLWERERKHNLERILFLPLLWSSFVCCCFFWPYN